MTHDDDLSPWVARGLYVFGFALMLHAAIDLFSSVWPPRPSNLPWRYGFLGLAAGYLQTPTFGLLMIGGTAVWQKNHRVVRATGFIFTVLALILLGVVGIFGLDVLAMVKLRPPETRSGILYGGIFQEVKYAVAIVVFAFLGTGLSKTGSRMAAAAHARPKKPGIVSNAGARG